MRVSLRRLWAAMRSFSNCFEHEPDFDLLARKTRKLARKLGSVRDLDVLIEMLQAHLPDESARVALEELTQYCLNLS